MMTMRPARRGPASGREIADSVRASLGYLSLHLSPSGRFDDVDDTRTEHASSAYDVLAHAGATTVLYRLVGSSFADAALDATAERAFSYVRQRLAPAKCRECRGEHGTRLVDGRIARLGVPRWRSWRWPRGSIVFEKILGHQLTGFPGLSPDGKDPQPFAIDMATVHRLVTYIPSEAIADG